MRDNRSKYSWKTSDPRDISDGLKSRKLYNETRGTKFQTETKIVRNDSSGGDCGCLPSSNDSLGKAMSSGDGKRNAQSTMGLFGSSSSKGSRAFGGSGIFEKLMREAQTDPGSQATKSSNPASWMRGVNSNVSDDKRGALERQLKRVAQLEAASKQSHLSAIPPAPMVSSAPVSQESNQAPAQPMYPAPPSPAPMHLIQLAQSSANPPQLLQPMGEIAASLASGLQPASSGFNPVGSMLSKVENREIFMSMRTSLGEILLAHELPGDVAEKLRKMARDLSELDRQLAP
ncbi:MAG: hypothetical protein V1875_00080 [Candidatus Altiarchaeota archaeon]